MLLSLIPTVLEPAQLVLAAYEAGRGNGLGIAAMAVGGWLIVRGVGRSMENHRRNLAATDRKRCGNCQTIQPGFASYCRNCGGRF